MLYGLGDLIEPTHGRAVGVGEGHVFSVGEEVLHRLGVSSQELPLRSEILLDQFVNFICSVNNHLFHRRPSSLRSSPLGCIEHSPENGKPATTRPSFASVAGRTTGSASSLIGCHVLQRDELLSLYPYWPFLCLRGNYSNAAITMHPLDGRVFGLSIRVPR